MTILYDKSESHTSSDSKMSLSVAVSNALVASLQKYLCQGIDLASYPVI